MRILITGVAGFIGYHLAKRLLNEGHIVTGIDNLNTYYNVQLKKDRINQLCDSSNFASFRFVKEDISNAEGLHRIFATGDFSHVIHLAAQAGVRYSLEQPLEYVKANLTGFANVLEECRNAEIEHLIYASSSSVYGMNTSMPYSPHQPVNHPESLYAATKKGGELLAHSYSHLWKLPTTGLRFFTVYGPWGRPDMALYLFTDAIINDRPINLFNNGNLQRDFTYIDDIIEGILRLIPLPAESDEEFDPSNPDPASSSAPWRIYNIGNSHRVPLKFFINTIEKCLGKKAIINYLPMQPGDVHATWADISDLARKTGFKPSTSLAHGIEKYITWHKQYYGGQ